MKTKILTVLGIPLVALVAVSLAFACGAGDGQMSSTTSSKLDIVDTAVSAGSFNTLVTALKEANLVQTLKSDGPFTVFAPTDEAFAKLPEGTLSDLLKPENKDKLTAILTYHVIPGKVMSNDVVNILLAKTVNGKGLKVNTDSAGVKINDANIVKADIETSNGVIHVIDAVVLP